MLKIITLVFFIAVSYMQLLSQSPCPEEDWPGYPYHCVDEQQQKYYTTINGAALGCGSCNFTLEYCWRWIPPTQQTEDRFDVKFQKITYNDPSCEECARQNYDLLVKLLHKQVLIEQRANHTIEGNTKEHNYLVLRSACVVYDGSEYLDCGKPWGCCFKDYTISMDEEEPPNITQYVQMAGTSYYYPTPPPYECTGAQQMCQLKCGLVDGITIKPFCLDDQYSPAYTTGTPFSFPLFPSSCPGCIVTVSYEYRNYGPWNDIKITGFSFSPECSTCFDLSSQTVIDEVKQFIINYLLGGGGPFTLPPVGNTWSNYRIVMAPCWKVVNPGEGNCKWEYCLPYDFCCITTFSVTNNGGGDIDISDIDRIGYVQECEIDTCFALCAEIPTKFPPSGGKEIKAIETETTVAVPNPTTGNVDIHYTGNYIGLLSLKIYDKLGNLVKSTEANKKTRELIIPLNLDLYPTGTYIYQFYICGKDSIKGSFILKK